MKIRMRVDADGLHRILADLTSESGLSTVVHGNLIRILPDDPGNFIVNLTKPQTKILAGKIPQKTIMEVYGIR